MLRGWKCTTEEIRSLVRLLWAEQLIGNYIKKCFWFRVGILRRVKRFTTGYRNVANILLMTKMLATEVRKWLRQQSKDFYAAGFDALVKR
jgi:hypothetical protein